MLSFRTLGRFVVILCRFVPNLLVGWYFVPVPTFSDDVKPGDFTEHLTHIFFLFIIINRHLSVPNTETYLIDVGTKRLNSIDANGLSWVRINWVPNFRGHETTGNHGNSDHSWLAKKNDLSVLTNWLSKPNNFILDSDDDWITKVFQGFHRADDQTKRLEIDKFNVFVCFVFNLCTGLTGWCCPCFLLYSISSRMGEGCLYAYCCSEIAPFTLRAKLRTEHHIQVGPQTHQLFLTFPYNECLYIIQQTGNENTQSYQLEVVFWSNTNFSLLMDKEMCSS